MTDDPYKQLFYSSPVPMYIFDDRTFDFYAVNEAVTHQYGYTEEEFLTKKATDIRPSDEIDSFYKANTNVPEKYTDFERWHHIKKNGEIFYVHIYTHNTEFVGKKVRLVLAVDIDASVRTESELKKKIKSSLNWFD